MIQNTGRQKIATVDKLSLSMFWHFCLKIDLNNTCIFKTFCRLWKKLPTYFICLSNHKQEFDQGLAKPTTTSRLTSCSPCHACTHACTHAQTHARTHAHAQHAHARRLNAFWGNVIWLMWSRGNKTMLLVWDSLQKCVNQSINHLSIYA